MTRTSWPTRVSAWLSTVRIAASSSATRMLPRTLIGSAPVSASWPSGSCFQAGIRMRKLVPRGEESHSMMPPCSPTILATSARPRPEPFGLVVMNGIEQDRQDVLGDAGTVVADA